MATVDYLSAGGPELEIGSDYWSKVSFPHTEEVLAAKLDELYRSGESSRAALQRKVEGQLACCHHIGLLAGVELPTPLMAEAEQAIRS